MKINDQKGSLNLFLGRKVLKQVKKFNSKGYFHQVQPYDSQYLKIKHETYQKHRPQDKQNYVYNLASQRMRIGFYEMKGYHIEEPHIFIKKRRTLKTINYTNQDSRLQQSKFKNQTSQKLVSSLLNKYMKRKQKLKTKSERTLVSIFSQIRSNSQSVQSNSRQISHHSFKTSESESRILSVENKNPLKPKYLKKKFQSQKQNITIIAAYRDKIKSRKNRIKTTE